MDEEMGGSNVLRNVGIVFMVLVVAAVVVYFVWVAPARREPAQQEVAPVAVAPTPQPTPTLQERLSARLQGVTLATSDLAVREVVAALSSHPKLVEWLASEDLVRRFAAAVNNVADGTSPRPHLENLRPRGAFRVTRADDVITVDPRSWRRYDLVAEVFASIDAAGAVTALRELQPLTAEAHREISRPGFDFEGRLLAAIDHLLETPVLEGDEVVREKVVTFAYADDALEALSDAQRHLLRMGPENVRRVQAKLSELKAELLRPVDATDGEGEPDEAGEGGT